MNVLQKIFKDHFEEMIYIQHPRDSVIENVEKMIHCGDPSFGGGAHRAGNEGRRRFYFGGMDPYRMVANTAIYADFQPPSQGFRADPYDNQSGEIEVEGRGLRYQEYERTRSLICIKELL